MSAISAVSTRMTKAETITTMDAISAILTKTTGTETTAMMDAISAVSTRATGTETITTMDAVMIEMEEALFRGRRKTHNSNFYLYHNPIPSDKRAGFPSCSFSVPLYKNFKIN